MKTVLILFFTLTSFISSAQDFGMDDSVKLVSKPTSSITPPHENFQFINYSGDSLPIRWRINYALSFYPSQWVFALQDNENYYNPMIDSSDVIIPDSAGTMDKIIINLYHGGIAGAGELVIDLINLDSVQEVHTIKFIFDIYEDHNEIMEISGFNTVELYPNPVKDLLKIKLVNKAVKNIQLFDCRGRSQPATPCLQSDNECMISTQDLAKGLYFLVIETDQNEHFSTRFVKD